MQVGEVAPLPLPVCMVSAVEEWSLAEPTGMELDMAQVVTIAVVMVPWDICVVTEEDTEADTDTEEDMEAVTDTEVDMGADTEADMEAVMEVDMEVVTDTVMVTEVVATGVVMVTVVATEDIGVVMDTVVVTEGVVTEDTDIHTTTPILDPPMDIAIETMITIITTTITSSTEVPFNGLVLQTVNVRK